MKLFIVLMIILLSHGSDVKSRRGRMNLANPSYEADPEFLSELTSTLAKRSQIEDTTEWTIQRNISDANRAMRESLVFDLKVIYVRANQTDLEKLVNVAKAVHYHFFKYAVEIVCEDKNAVYSPMDEEAVRVRLNSVGYNITGIDFSEFLDTNPVYRESVYSGFNEGLNHCPQDVEAFEANYNSSLLNDK